jgi:hypothetical protein
MAVPLDVRDSGFTALILENVNAGGKFNDYQSPAVLLAARYYENARVCLY